MIFGKDLDVKDSNYDAQFVELFTKVDNYWSPPPGYRVLRITIPVKGNLYASGDGARVFCYRVDDGHQNSLGITGPRIILEKIEPPTPKYLPFTLDDFKMFWRKPVRHKSVSDILIISRMSENYVYMEGYTAGYQDFLDNFVFVDTNTPCGKLE